MLLRWKFGGLAFLGLGMMLCCTAAGQGGPSAGLTLEQLGRMQPCELAELFTQADVGQPLMGRTRGSLLYLTDRRLPRLKVRLANVVWRGKAASEDGCFVNRWLGGIRAIGSRYVIGPSWVDGRPAIIMEYAPGTPLFHNMHDELREVAPGLYLGPVFERWPCPKFRGFVALQQEPCRFWRLRRP